MLITLIAMIVGFGIFFLYYDTAGTGTKSQDDGVQIAMGICFSSYFLGHL